MKVCIVSAMDPNRAIGKDNSLLWRLPKDMKFFREITMGNIVVMGRKTFESIGSALNGRENVVLTTDMAYKADNCIILHSIDQLLDRYKNELDRTLFIIGGAQVYRTVLDLSIIDEMYITHIHKNYPEADAFFPEFTKEEWHQKEIETDKEFTIIKYYKK